MIEQLVRLQPQQFIGERINPEIVAILSNRQQFLAKADIEDMREGGMAIAIPCFMASVALFGPPIAPRITRPKDNAAKSVSWNLSNICTPKSYVKMYVDEYGNATFSVVDDSKPRIRDDQGIQRRPNVPSTLDRFEDAKIVSENLMQCLSDEPLKPLGSQVAGPTDDEPFVVAGKNNGKYLATYKQKDGLYEVQAMVFKPTISGDNTSVHGSVSLVGKKMN